MTTICAVQSPGHGVWIGSDTAAVNCYTSLYGIEKWIVREPWGVGVAGNMRTINIIQAHADGILHAPHGAWTVANRIRDLLHDDSWRLESDNEGGPAEFGQQMIIAHPGGVWSIDPGFGVVEIPDGEFWADGSGRAYALGAAHACDGQPADKVHAALAAALRYDSSSGGEPFVRVIS